MRVKQPLLLLVLLSFLLPAFSSHGQNRELIKKLREQLPAAEGQERFDLLNDLAWEYRWAAPDSTIHLAQEAYDYGKKMKLKRLAESINFMGVGYNYKGNRLKSFEMYEDALKVATQQKDSSQIAFSNNNLGRLFFEQGLLSRSYDYFVRALAIFEAVGDSSGLAYTYQSLANLYKSQRDYPKAESSYLKAYKMRLMLKNTRDIMSALVQLSRLYQENNQHDKALTYLHMADSAGHVINDEINLAEIKTYIAESYMSKGLLTEAEKMCREGMAVILRIGTVRMMPQAYLTMGQIKFAKNEMGETKKYLNQAMEVSSRIRDLNSKMEAHYWLWKLSEKENNHEAGLHNHNQYLILKDSIKDLDLTRQVERLQFEIEIQRQEQENELLKLNQAKDAAVIQQQKLQNIILIVITAFGSILVFVQWRNNKRRHEINEKLAAQNQFIQNQREEIIHQNEKLSRRNQELSDLNHEKDTLMSIVAHDLKSPLNRIKGIVDLIEIEDGLSEEQRSYLLMMKDATRAGLDLIKDLLDVHMLEENVVPNYTRFDISTFLLDKTESFRLTAESKNIHLHITRIENEMVNLDADYLSRIMDNLLSNAIKFSRKDATVDVAAGRSGGNLWISVRDQGPGFSEKDRLQLFQKFKKLSARPTAGETSNGLGLAIVKTLVDRLKGDISLTTEQGKGSEFTVRFPLA